MEELCCMLHIQVSFVFVPLQGCHSPFPNPSSLAKLNTIQGKHNRQILMGWAWKETTARRQNGWGCYSTSRLYAINIISRAHSTSGSVQGTQQEAPLSATSLCRVFDTTHPLGKANPWPAVQPNVGVLGLHHSVTHPVEI